MVTIYDNLEILEGVKDDIKIAIEDKGIAVGDTPFIDYANKIAEISVGDGDYADGYIAGVDAGKQIQKSLLTPISITENGDYSSENGYNNIHVNVPDINGSYEDGYNVGVEDGKATQKSLMETRTFHRNGTYSREDGYKEVIVAVETTNGDYQDGFEDGIEEGKTAQKALLESITITENGTYLREDGYNEVVVEVVDANGSYDDGYDAGKAAQKALMESRTFHRNGTYSREDGYSTVVVDVADENSNYQDGYDTGYSTGVEEGKQIQKLLLTGITITENGTYTREDGYNTVVVNVEDTNGSYDDGYDAGLVSGYDSGYTAGETEQKSKLTNITITENGTYSTENGYSEVIVNIEDTNGNYQDGYNTGIEEGKITGYNSGYTAGDIDGYNRGYNEGETDQKAKLTNITISNNGTYTNEDGYSTVVVDVPDLNGDYNEGYDVGKIDGYNSGYTAGEAAQKSLLTGITITENGTYLKDDGYNEVIVNVPQTGGTTGSLVLVEGTRFESSTFTTIPDYYDFSQITNMYKMFFACTNLTTIPLIDTSKATNMDSMFSNCRQLTTIPQINTSNVTNMYGMFSTCYELIKIPLIDTSNVTNMSFMFNNCSSLTTISQLDTSKVNIMNQMFYRCTSLTSIPPLNAENLNYIINFFAVEMTNLTDVGGWIGLKINWDDDGGLAVCPNLAYQSCINILNGLADMTGTDGRTLKVHSNFLTTVGDEISIATAKNWTISV